MTTYNWTIFFGTVLVTAFGLMNMWQFVFGDTEAECLKYRSSEMVVLRSGGFGNCYWVVDKFLWNGSEYNQVDIAVAESVSGSSAIGTGSTSSYEYETFLLTKVKK